MLDHLPTGSNVPADAHDFLNWACNESPSSQPIPEAELEAHYRQRIEDEARCEAAAGSVQTLTPDLSYTVQVSMAARGRFAACVCDSKGRTFKAGRYKTEAQAWTAAERLARELRAGEVAAIA